MADLKEIAERGTAAFNAHDADALAALDDPNVLYTAPGPTGRTEYRGREAGREYNQNWFDAFPDAKITINTEVLADDCIVQEGVFRGTNTGAWKAEGGGMPATGKAVTGAYCLVSKVKDGLVISGNLYFDQMELMAQLGLIPEPVGAAT
ncbi:MAG TPA: ester cyclase [Candidatus Solibacter sp.]|jgi:predicted ester cyclase|nr:ester cyclase [Candidatus Solibacter sp.]